MTEPAAWIQGEPVLAAHAAPPLRLVWQELLPEVEVMEAGALSASVVVDPLPVGAITAAVPGLRNGEGTLGAEVRVTGTPADPWVGGWARIEPAAVTVDTLGTRFEGIRPSRRRNCSAI